MSQTYHTQKAILKAHELLDNIAQRPEYSDKKGMLKIFLPVNQGGIRTPQVWFENEVGVEVRVFFEVVRKERMEG